MARGLGMFCGVCAGVLIAVPLSYMHFSRGGSAADYFLLAGMAALAVVTVGSLYYLVAHGRRMSDVSRRRSLHVPKTRQTRASGKAA